MTGETQTGSANGSGLQGFDSVLALRLALASLEVYDPAIIDGAIYCAALDLRARVQDCGDHVIVAFRGTASLQNWIVDANAIPNSLGIHSGGYNAWQAIKRAILTILGRNTKPVYLAGHSLGGMLAAIAVFDIPNVKAIYTFGEPRNRTKHAIVSGIPHFRFVDKEDIVPHVPGLIAGYRHRGHLIFFTFIGTVEIDPPVWKQLFMHSVGIGIDLYRLAQNKLPEWVAIKEHQMKRYYELLATMPA
jgi:hypothetical protein